MRVAVTTAIALNGLELAAGLVTWFEVDACTDSARSSIPLATATVARVHVEEALELGESLHDVLLASGGLEDVWGVYVDHDGLRECYRRDRAQDLLVVTDLVIHAAGRSEHLETALVRRLGELLGAGCALLVLPYESRAQAVHWSNLGLCIGTPERARGLLHSALRPHAVREASDGSSVVTGSLPANDALD